jgi:hypothetical protein
MCVRDLDRCPKYFHVYGLMNFGSLLSILLLYRDTDVAAPVTAPGEKGVGRRDSGDVPSTSPRLMILFLVNMADRAVGPNIPLFLEELGSPRAGLEMVAGLSGTSMLGGAAGPIIAGFSIRGIFVVNSVVYLLMMVFVYLTVRH